MKTFSIEGAIKHGWDLWKTHKKTLVISTLILCGIQSLGDSHTHNTAMHWHTPSLLATLFSILAFIIYFIVQIGWLKLNLAIEDGGTPTWEEMFKYKHLFWKFLGAGILLGLGTALLSIFFILPGIYFFLTYSFVPLIIVDKGVDIGAAFKQSAELTVGVKWALIGLFIAILIINIIGAMALLVGLLISIPVGVLAHVHVYRTLSKASESVI